MFPRFRHVVSECIFSKNFDASQDAGDRDAFDDDVCLDNFPILHSFRYFSCVIVIHLPREGLLGENLAHFDGFPVFCSGVAQNNACLDPPRCLPLNSSPDLQIDAVLEKTRRNAANGVDEMVCHGVARTHCPDFFSLPAQRKQTSQKPIRNRLRHGTHRDSKSNKKKSIQCICYLEAFFAWTTCPCSFLDVECFNHSWRNTHVPSRGSLNEVGGHPANLSIFEVCASVVKHLTRVSMTEIVLCRDLRRFCAGEDQVPSGPIRHGDPDPAAGNLRRWERRWTFKRSLNEQVHCWARPLRARQYLSNVALAIGQASDHAFECFLTPGLVQSCWQINSVPGIFVRRQNCSSGWQSGTPGRQGRYRGTCCSRTSRNHFRHCEGARAGKMMCTDSGGGCLI
jgi:hypothetical protein